MILLIPPALQIPVRVCSDHARGLQGVSLPSGHGMLFQFDRPCSPIFQMKAVDYPLHIIGMRGDSVTRVWSDCSVGSEDLYPFHNVTAVLEVRADDFCPKQFRGKVQRTAQIVDEQKFIERLSDILYGAQARIDWKLDALTGNKTERVVITRADLIEWLQSVRPESRRIILNATLTDQGMRLLGDAIVLLGIAEVARLGFKGRTPGLVLFRSAKQ